MKLCHGLAAAILLLSVNLSYGSPTPKAKIKPPEKLVAIAHMLAFKDFPKAIDIIAIAKIESTYNEKARNGISRGVMQVNKGPWELSANMQAGVKLLREYYEQLKSPVAAVMAYNIGIGNYNRGKRNAAYLHKYGVAKNELTSQGYSDRYRNLPSTATGHASSDRLPGSTGSVLLDTDPRANHDSISQWGSQEGDSSNDSTRSVSSDLGKVKGGSVWDFFSGSSSDP